MKKVLLALVLFCTFMSGTYLASFSQSRTVEVTAVTLTVDTVQSVEQMEAVKKIITSHPEVGDFDIKLRKCNFTLDNASAQVAFNTIKQELQDAGYTVGLVAYRSGQVLTKHPSEFANEQKAPVIAEPDK